MATIFKKVKVIERLPEFNKPVTTIDENGKQMVYELVVIPNVQDIDKPINTWCIDDGVFRKTPKIEAKLVYWLEEVDEYDCTADTLLHIKRVAELLNRGAIELIHRAEIHDNSKLGEFEKKLFNKLTPEFRLNNEYGSEAWLKKAEEIKPAIDHHHSQNRHHPEFHIHRGVSGMNLFDIIEMLFDWKAATERNPNNKFEDVIQKNFIYFGIDGQLKDVIYNTAYFLGFIAK